MAAQSRSQHKSQGMGSTLQRGEIFEYFLPIKGDNPTIDIMEGIDLAASRIMDKPYNDSLKKNIKGIQSAATLFIASRPGKPQRKSL